MRADRLLSLLLLLQTRGRMTAQQLAEELEVSERTIYRDLDALTIAGIPVFAERGPNGGCELLDNYRTTLTGLTEPEIQALFAAIVPDPATDLGKGNLLQQALLKLTAALPARQQHQPYLIRQRIHLDPTAWFQPIEPMPHLPVVQEAIWQEQKVRLVYRRGDGQWVKRLLAPYGLVAKATVWYVVGDTNRTTQVFRVSRIQEAVLTDIKFKRSVEFDLPAYWQNWCQQFEQSQQRYEVRLQIHPNRVQDLVPAFGEGIYHLVSSTNPDPQGYLTLTFHFASPEQAQNTLLTLGTAITILAPEELRHQLATAADQLARHHQLKPPTFHSE